MFNSFSQNKVNNKIINKQYNKQKNYHKKKNYNKQKNYHKKVNTSDSSNSNKKLILNVFFVVFSVVLFFFVIKCAYYIYLDNCDKIDIMSYLFSFKIDPCISKEKDIIRTITREKEVFHISDQIYTYEEAKCKCDSYGVRLATKHEMIDAYNNGANWCTYGWCEGGSAYYPVQDNYYDLVENNPDLRGTCGKPGLNGGIFDKNMRIGINCYGVKPKGVHKQSIIIDDDDETEIENVCKTDKVNVNKTDNILSFNNDKWSSYD